MGKAGSNPVKRSVPAKAMILYVGAKKLNRLVCIKRIIPYRGINNG
jgi:hypothetical protein